jgi:oxygen-independent coproporphyrinogen-3 oxidase
LDLRPDRFAVFGYAHVPGFKKHQSLLPAEALPGVEERLSQQICIHSVLTGHGYEPVGLDHYALPEDELAHAAADGGLVRNFQGYSTGRAAILIGMGASSISCLPQGYVQNAAFVPAWRASIEAGTLATARGIALTREDRVRRHVIERLMCYLNVDLDAVCREFRLAQDHFADELERLKPMSEGGLISISKNHIRVHDKHRQAVRVACSVFDTYSLQTGNRHALTA